MRAALARYADGQKLTVSDLPYRLRRALVAARHGVRPSSVDRWTVDEFVDAQRVIGIDV